MAVVHPYSANVADYLKMKEIIEELKHRLAKLMGLSIVQV